ncbi:MAG: hypothetical protein NDI84_03210, partial [Steroidobacteraceae bacterium]|nr:hypothetical protein [Steroidobacteraceae bacterium]
TVPWLVTTGNGRYWIAILLCAGPVVVGLVFLLPVTRSFRLFLAGGLLAAQTFVVLANPPWDSWGMVTWDDAPYFQISVPAPDDSKPPVTYVTMSSNSFSLIAPQFPATARWINISSGMLTARDAKARELLLSSAKRLELLTPSIDGEITSDRQPSPEFRRALNSLMADARLSIDAKQSCVLLKSDGVSAVSTNKRRLSAEAVSQLGFWLCPLSLSADGLTAPAPRIDPRTEAAFERVERMCPRFFPPASGSLRINGGMLRQYPSADMKLYVLDNGDVKYKYWRALNATLIGTVDEVLDGKATINCDRIRGRSGLPWEREI